MSPGATLTPPRRGAGPEGLGGNLEVAAHLDEVGELLAAQHADSFRVRAYHNAAGALRELPTPVAELYRDGGLAGLEQIPGVGEGIARAIRDLLERGHLPMLERLRAEHDPVQLLATLPGIGRGLADRLHHDLGIGSLEELEVAVHDGRLAAVPGFGPKRLAALREALAQRLARSRAAAPPRAAPPSVAELLELDAEYRDAAAAGRLPLITPRRFNPEKRAWLPVLHATRGPRHYTALFSNTARAHRLGRTRDWVVIYAEGAPGDFQATVVTAQDGPLAGRRVVRGREVECGDYYAAGPRRHR